MTNLYRFGGLLAALLMSASVYAGDVQVENAWTRASAPGQDAAGVDLTITSKQAAALVGVSSAACKTVELHSITSESGMMKMREVEAIQLPAGKHVNLHEGGYHLMLIGLKAPLKAGVSIPLTLSIKVANKSIVKVETQAEVKPLPGTNNAAPQENDHSISY
jgi:copper(I)-binding protein